MFKNIKDQPNALKYKILIILAILLFGGFYFNKENLSAFYNSNETPQVVEEVKTDRIEEIEIVEDSTYGSLMASSSVGYEITMDIYEASKPLYDLVNVRLGRFLVLVFDKDTDNFKKLIYQIDSEEKLHVSLTEPVVQDTATSTATSSPIWIAEIISIDYEIKIKEAGGVVESSMYQAALDNDIDERAIIELANAMQWTIDFAMDPRVGDTFKFVYEERYLDDEYVMPGRILAGKYVNDGTAYEIYYFEELEDNKGYFDKEGSSVQKMFLRAPVAFKYISSGFTTGRRYVEAFNVSTGHKAIDYAAAYGTPIRAVGDGTITSAGWNSGGYGYLTKIRHNGTYSTNYAHQSKIIVSRGQKVLQGQTIGYVGSTGFSTGPHLHYEMLKNGSKVNPLREILPPGKPIKDENKDRFFNEIKEYQEFLQKD